MEIGNPRRIYVVEPIEDPVPHPDEHDGERPERPTKEGEPQPAETASR
jgi:hypothetical protein